MISVSQLVRIGGVGLEAAELRRESATACGASLEGERNSVSSSQLDQKNSWFARKKTRDLEDHVEVVKTKVSEN